MGSNGILRLYEMGKKHLLKKCEYKKALNLINGIKVINNRIFASDAADSIHLFKYIEKEN